MLQDVRGRFASEGEREAARWIVNACGGWRSKEVAAKRLAAYLRARSTRNCESFIGGPGPDSIWRSTAR